MTASSKTTQFVSQFIFFGKLDAVMIRAKLNAIRKASENVDQT